MKIIKIQEHQYCWGCHNTNTVVAVVDITHGEYEIGICRNCAEELVSKFEMDSKFDDIKPGRKVHLIPAFIDFIKEQNRHLPIPINDIMNKTYIVRSIRKDDGEYEITSTHIHIDFTIPVPLQYLIPVYEKGEK